MRPAEEYDAAQERGEVAGHCGGRKINGEYDNIETLNTADLGIRRVILEVQTLRKMYGGSRGDNQHSRALRICFANMVIHSRLSQRLRTSELETVCS